MGSKMAAGTRVVQVVKPHVPLIKFPERLVGPSQPSVQDNLRLVQQQTPAATRISQKPTAVVEELRPPPLQNVPSSRTLGVADSVELVKKLPPKYRRKPMEKDEMEYIQRGGPE
ncbi:28S ribosomal protein S36, mitochondrial [Protopterus annectens]|uniref:28S ribosomal protein S36, mitochondrial n=1 Tax=Protopterus annectens TaxID=7888 RepID=UPI001CFC1994|nr:28S ribosomal protein S36, mitochondrial [Protopterus annectens]